MQPAATMVELSGCYFAFHRRLRKTVQRPTHTGAKRRICGYLIELKVTSIERGFMCVRCTDRVAAGGNALMGVSFVAGNATKFSNLPQDNNCRFTVKHCHTCFRLYLHFDKLRSAKLNLGLHIFCYTRKNLFMKKFRNFEIFNLAQKILCI